MKSLMSVIVTINQFKIVSASAINLLERTPHSHSRTLECVTEKYFLTYVVGTQKNRLNKMVLLSTQNIC